MILEFKDVAARIANKQILSEITFQLSHGEFMALVGPNGAGKTTLLRCVIGLIKPSRGSVCLDGLAINQLPQKKIGRILSYVPQSLQVVFDSTVQQFFSDTSDSHCDELISDLGIKDFLNRRFLSLSGGERQRVLLASALARQPKLLLIDELTQYVDAQTTEFLGDYLSSYRKSNGISILAVSHDLEWIAKFAQRAIVMKQGKIDAECCDLSGKVKLLDLMIPGR